MEIVRGLTTADGSAARVRITRKMSSSAEDPPPPLYIAQRECAQSTISLLPLEDCESKFLDIVLSSDSDDDSVDAPPPKKCLNQSRSDGQSKPSPNWVVSAAHFETVKRRLHDSESQVQRLNKQIAALQDRVTKIEGDRDVFQRCFLAGQESQRQHHICKICFNREYDLLLMPCLHQGLCKNCYHHLAVKEHGKKECPFCMQKIEKVGGLYYA